MGPGSARMERVAHVPGIGLEQSQQLELTPEVREGIEIMAMPVMELRSLICDRALSNPFLAIDESYECHDIGAGSASGEKASEEAQESSIEEDAWLHGIEPGVWDNSWDIRTRSGSSADATSPDDTFSRTADERSCLEGVILEQLKLDLRDPLDISIAEHLLTGIDEGGYLRMDTDILADGLGTYPDRVEFVLSKMQRDCTPAGIGARSLQERLSAQLAASGDEDDITRRIIENHLEDLAEGRMAKIASRLRVSASDVKSSLEKIRRLDPHPASAFDRTTSMPFPEVMVIGETGNWKIKVRNGLLPKVILDDSYTELLDSRTFDKGSVQKMKELVREAKGFIRAIDLRKAAVISVACIILEKQSDFFDEGISGLRATTMAEVASIAGLSESTVSRVANSVMMDTPRGVIGMRYFFHSGVGADLSSEGASSMAVKQAIRELVDAEDGRHPLSDTKLVELLGERGMNVSRRTVNKYRTALGILSSSKRKTYE